MTGEAPPASVPAPAPEQQENGGSGRRSKRARGAVDYSALEAELQQEEAGGATKKLKSEGGDELQQ